MNDLITQLKLPPLPEPLPSPIIDSHTHLDSTREYSGLEIADSLALAKQVGVEKVIEVGCDLVSSKIAIDIANNYSSVLAVIGIHPNDAARITTQGNQTILENTLAEISELAAKDNVVGLGETGLDYYRTREATGHQAQKQAFKFHINLAKKTNKTLVIHDRDAHDDVLQILEDSTLPERVIMHCFSGNELFARRCIELNTWLSFSGVVTFKSAPYLRAALKEIPLEKILVETDAPYLTAEPNRGRANAPYLIVNTVRFMADELKLDLNELCKQLRKNTQAAYALQAEND